ncbi:MAG: RNA polymerase sigma factor [Planctomycetaceae bacterium]|nr:RNA polymerase sigma factor [Planctomycetaceae bacterium]
MTDSLQTNRSQSVDELVRLVRTSRDAFGQLFDCFYPPIFAYCLRRLLVRAAAEDVTSEVFLKAATGIHAFSGTSGEEFRRWLFRIATNEISAELRNSIRRRELLEEAARMGTIKADVSTSLLHEDAVIEWQSAYEALGELSDREQSLISLRFFAGLRHHEIAEVLELKEGTVRVALSRALEKLRGRLQGSVTVRRTSSGMEGGDQ